MSKRLDNKFQFIDLGREDPKKKTLRTRKSEYVEIYEPFTREAVADQSHRLLAVSGLPLRHQGPMNRNIFQE